MPRKPLADPPSDSETSSLEAPLASASSAPPATKAKTKKDGQPRREWVFTEARRLAFEKARKTKEELGKTTKEIKQVKQQLRETKKESLVKLKDAVVKETRKKEKIEQSLTTGSSEEDEGPASPAPKAKSRPRAKRIKKVLYYGSSASSSSDSDSDAPPPRRRSTKPPVNLVINNGPSPTNPTPAPRSTFPPRSTSLFI